MGFVAFCFTNRIFFATRSLLLHLIWSKLDSDCLPMILLRKFHCTLFLYAFWYLKVFLLLSYLQKELQKCMILWLLVFKYLYKWSTKVSFFVQCIKKQLITLQNFNIETCLSQFLWFFSLKCWYRGQIISRIHLSLPNA